MHFVDLIDDKSRKIDRTGPKRGFRSPKYLIDRKVLKPDLKNPPLIGCLKI